MKVKIISGTKKIGGCITEIMGDSGSRILIDYGCDLNGNSNTNIDGLTSGKSLFDALFITHSHGDHIGLVNIVNKDIPVYVNDIGKKIHNLTSDFVRNYECINRETIDLKFNQKIKIKDIVITPYIVDHSSYNSCMFLIEVDGKKILHTGDYRGHGRKGKIFENLLRKIGNVDLLITEGTTLSRGINKFKTEDDLVDELVLKTKDYNQVFVLQSSTNIDRVVTMYKVAMKTKKVFIEDLFTAIVAKGVCRNIPNPVTFNNVYTWIPSLYYTDKDIYNKYAKSMEKYRNFNYNRDYFMLVKMSMFRDIKYKLYDGGYINNACLVYSMWDGYKEDKSLSNFLNKVEELGIDIITVHTSGHADLMTMKLLNDLLNPKKTIVIHTEDNSKAKDIFNGIIELEDNEYFELR